MQQHGFDAEEVEYLCGRLLGIRRHGIEIRLHDRRDVLAVRVHQRDQLAHQRRLTEILELERGIAARVSPKTALAVGSLIPLLHHDQHVRSAQHARAVAPARRQLQHGEVVGLDGKLFVDGRDTEVGQRQGRREMLKHEQGRQDERPPRPPYVRAAPSRDRAEPARLHTARRP